MKKFLKKTLLFGTPLFILIALSDVSEFNTSGDLGALGLKNFDVSYREYFESPKVTSCKASLCNSITELNECSIYDILIIGDSFSYTRYQEYLSEKINKSIATFHKHNADAGAILNTLLTKNRDLIPQIVIIECVERTFISRLTNMSLDTILELENENINYIPKEKTEKKSTNFLKRAQDFYKGKTDINKYKPVRHASLSKDLFTCKGKQNDLYFYVEDLYECSDSDIDIAIEKIKMLHDYALKQGIYLIYMVATDKYDVYQNHIVKNRYKPNNLFSERNRFDSLPYFINTKKVLTDAVDNGVQDIYWADDTHWSPIGAKIVAEEIARKLNSIDILDKQ